MDSALLYPQNDLFWVKGAFEGLLSTWKTANSLFSKLSKRSETNYCCSKLIKLKNEPADVQKYIRRAKLKMARRISSIWTNRPDMKLGEIVSYSNPMCRNIWEFVWKCKLKNYIKHFVTRGEKLKQFLLTISFVITSL